MGRSNGSSVTFQAPVTTAIALATGMPLPDHILDASVGRESHDAAQVQQSFDSPGEVVVAVQYRRIRFHFFDSRKIDPKHLENETRWKYVWDMRGQTSDASDVIEASLAYDDAEDEEGDGDGDGSDDLLEGSSEEGN
ncbi:hypothetical protein LTR17_009880 [Elasticomyces elasticus]|nr:hypothetical protein LTR17_009880 [Elasticomyces elasticus]